MDPVIPDTQPTPPPSAEPEYKADWKKWLLIVVVVIVLSSIATLVFAASQLNKQPSPQPQPEAGQPLAETPTPLPAEVSTKEGDSTAQKSARDGCVIGGCNSELCLDKETADEGVVSACVVRPEFACYKNATCEKQTDGKCGWTQTPQLQTCLKNPPSQ